MRRTAPNPIDPPPQPNAQRSSAARKQRRGRAAFTLAEVMVSLAASMMVLGGLVASMAALQRSLQGSENLAGAYSDQRRLTDYLTRDIRRSVGVAWTDASGNRASATTTETKISILDRASLILTLPAYYRSNTRGDQAYDSALAVVDGVTRVDYGTEDGGLGEPVEVTYRRIFFGREGCVCFVRAEAGMEETIVRQADRLTAEITLAAGGQTCALRTVYRANTLRAIQPVVTYDQLLLRNPRLDFRP